MKLAIAGSTGVLGRAVIPLLVQEGYAVRALARSTGKAKKFLPPSVEIVECDLLAPNIAQTIKTQLEGCDAVLHLATAIPRNMTAPNAWDANTRLRTDVVRMLLDATLAVGGKRYIQQSITMAYPDGGDDWITEEMPLDASPERARVTAPVRAMEEMVQNISTRELHWCILRGGNFVGADTFQERVIENLRAGTEIVPCDGKNFISLIHVADMATATVAALQHAPAGSIFNIVDEPLRQAEYSDRLAASIGAAKPLRDEKASCPPSWRCSNQHAKTLLNWAPTHPLIPSHL